MSRNKAQTDGLHVPLLNSQANKETEGDMTMTVLGCGKLWQDPEWKPLLDCSRLQAHWASPFSRAFSLPSPPSAALSPPRHPPAPLPQALSKKTISHPVYLRALSPALPEMLRPNGSRPRSPLTYPLLLYFRTRI